MKTLLINPYTNTNQTTSTFKNFLKTIPPINITYITTTLKQTKIPITYYNNFIHNKNLTKFETYIQQKKPNIINFSSITPTAPNITKLNKFYQKQFPNITLIQNNIHTTIFSKQILTSKKTNIIIHNKNKITTIKLINTLTNNKNLSTIKNISYLTNNKTIKNEPQPMIEDLDSIPFPT